MPHYYFHLASPDGFSPDEIGSEFADIEAAYLGACQAALEMSIEKLRERGDPSQDRFEISNEDGALLFDLPFSEILRTSARSASPDRVMTNLRHNYQRMQHANTELQGECEQAISLVRSARALLARPI